MDDVIEEVMDALDANYAVIISEAWGQKRVVKKVYFNVGQMGRVQDCLMWVAQNYGDYIAPNVRIDVYKVFFGHIVGQE